MKKSDLEKLDKGVRIYGDFDFRGDCRSEDPDLISFHLFLKVHHREFYDIFIHPKNEGKRTPQQAKIAKAKGAIKEGASDIIIPANPAFICELKVKNHKKSKWQPGQPEYLNTANRLGAFACVAFGLEAAKEAFNDYLKIAKVKK